MSFDWLPLSPEARNRRKHTDIVLCMLAGLVFAVAAVCAGSFGHVILAVCLTAATTALLVVARVWHRRLGVKH